MFIKFNNETDLKRVIHFMKENKISGRLFENEIIAMYFDQIPIILDDLLDEIMKDDLSEHVQSLMNPKQYLKLAKEVFEENDEEVLTKEALAKEIKRKALYGGFICTLLIDDLDKLSIEGERGESYRFTDFTPAERTTLKMEVCYFLAENNLSELENIRVKVSETKDGTRYRVERMKE